MGTGGTSPLTSPQWYIYGNWLPNISNTVVWLYAYLHIEPPRTADSQLHRRDLRKKTILLWPLAKSRNFIKFSYSSQFALFSFSWDQALDLLVSVSSTYRYAYTPDLSNSLSLSGLTTLRYGISYLEVSFTLRCFQRLSYPHFAILPCRWRDNRCTIGAFIPVLSY